MSQKEIELLDQRITPCSNAVAVTLSDTVDTMLTDPSAQDVDRDNKYCRGFHCNATGTLAVYFPELENSVSLSVIDGAYYPYSIKRFLSTGTTDITDGQIIALR